MTVLVPAVTVLPSILVKAAGRSSPVSSLFSTFPETVVCFSGTDAVSFTATGPSSAIFIVIVLVSLSPSPSVAVTPNSSVITSFGFVVSA